MTLDLTRSSSALEANFSTLQCNTGKQWPKVEVNFEAMSAGSTKRIKSVDLKTQDCIY